VADAGSTLTVDYIDGQAFHLGGYIVPGLAMQRNSLQLATEKVRFDAALAIDSLAPGTDTGQAVNRGVVHMLAAFIDSAVADLSSRVGQPAALVLAGGDAPLIGPFLESNYEYVSDLVLQGIDLVMQ
jgi:type III pantothenate kinase